MRGQSTLLVKQMLPEQDYDLGVTYYPGKANGVTGDLSRSVPQKVTLLRLMVQESGCTDLGLNGWKVDSVVL